MVKKEVDGVKKISYKAGQLSKKLNTFFDEETEEQIEN